MDDIWSQLTNPTTASGPTPAATIAALRNQNLLGQLGQITGDSVLGQVGSNLSSNAQRQAQQLGANQLTAQKEATQQYWRGVEEQHYQAQEKQAQNALAETMREHKVSEDLKRAELGLTSDGERDSDFQEHVDRIGQYMEKPLNASATRNPRNYAIMAEVARQYPNYDDTFYNNKTKSVQAFGGQGKQGQTLRSADVAIQHLGTLGSAVDALNNGNVRLWNQAKQAVQTQFGLSTAPTDFEGVKPIVSDELTKFIIGSGGGVTDREVMQKAVDSANSPQALRSVINRYVDLMHGQVMGLKQEYEANTGLKDFDQKLSPETRKALGLSSPANSAPSGWKIEIEK